MLRCLGCAERRYLIRGYCKFCKPETHQQYEAERRMWSAIVDRYERETSRKAIEHWSDFERWCDANIKTSEIQPNSTNDWWHMPGLQP